MADTTTSILLIEDDPADAVLVQGMLEDASFRVSVCSRLSAGLQRLNQDGLVLVDGAGQIVQVNTETETLFGYPRGELIGQEIELPIPERFRERHPEYLKSFFASAHEKPTRARLELVGRRRDGSEIPVEDVVPLR